MIIMHTVIIHTARTDFFILFYAGFCLWWRRYKNSWAMLRVSTFVGGIGARSRRSFEVRWAGWSLAPGGQLAGNWPCGLGGR